VTVFEFEMVTFPAAQPWIPLFVPIETLTVLPFENELLVDLVVASVMPEVYWTKLDGPGGAYVTPTTRYFGSR
jgi:hypothetical protein